MAAAAATPIPKGNVAALQLVKCKVSASLLPGNLVAGSKSFAYIHRNEVALVESKLVALGNEKAESTKVAYVEKDAINQVEFIKIAGMGEMIVLVNQAGAVFIYDDVGQKLLHSYKHTRPNGIALNLKEQHFRGIVTNGKEYLYIGTGGGEILVFNLTKTKFSLVKTVQSTPEGHGEIGGGISTLAYAATPNPTLISGDDWGQVLFWNLSGGGDTISTAAGKVTKLSGKGSPVTSLSYGQGFLAAGFGSGHIRLYDLARLSTGALVVEIGAHTRSINSVQIHPSRPLMISAGEDTFVTCWSLPTASGGQIRNLMAESPALGLLTGCTFGGTNQELIVTTIYDSRALALMHTP